jgi:hypothetical protein
LGPGARQARGGRLYSGRPYVVPSRHGDVWDYGGAAVEEMRGRGVQFEEYDTPETRTENGIARMPGGGEAAWFKDSEGNLLGVVPA